MTETDLNDRRVLVLGAGRHQVPLIQRARERGAFVVTSDYLPDSPGREFASLPLLTDALDSTVNIELAHEHDIDAVLTVGTDQALTPVADVAAARDLPCHVSPDNARAATDKTRMRAALSAADVPMSAFCVVDSDHLPDRSELGTGPWVVKPADAQGQRGTCRVDSFPDLPAAVADARSESRRRTALVEEFLVGPEATATAWVHDGNIDLLGVTDRVTYNPHPNLGIALRHVFPGIHASDHIDEVADVLGRVARAYEMTDGPLYVQMIISEDGPKVVEAAARIGGGHETALYREVAGVDLTDLSIDLACGLPPRGSGFDVRRSTPKCHGLINFVVAHAGEFTTLSSFDDLIDSTAVADGGWYRRPGFKQSEVVDAQGRIGWFLALADDRPTLIRDSIDAYGRLMVTNADGDNLVYWPEPELLAGT